MGKGVSGSGLSKAAASVVDRCLRGVVPGVTGRCPSSAVIKELNAAGLYLHVEYVDSKNELKMCYPLHPDEFRARAARLGFPMPKRSKSVEQRLFEAFHRGDSLSLSADDVQALLLLDDALRVRITNAACAEAGAPEAGCDLILRRESWAQFKRRLK